MDADGREMWRIEGYLPTDEFRAQLELALGRVAAMHKKWDQAEKAFAGVIDRYPATSAAPEALYWRNVSIYNRTHDHVPLQNVAKELRDRYPDSVWTKKASVWA
jgi:outer membrane protein assembly factor BamD (BamD/ComL family)